MMNIKQNVTEIKRLLHERKESGQALLHFLVSKGLSSKIAEKIIAELEMFRIKASSHGECVEGREIENLQLSVARRIKVAGELDFTKQNKLALIGPTGVGKSTTILKLADYYTIKNKKVALLSLDENKKKDLKEQAEALHLPFYEGLESGDQNVDIFLIDTEGCNFYLPNRIDDLGERLSQLGDDVEILLTLSAAAKEVDLYGAIHQFSPLCPATLLFSKLDETLASGVIINVCDKTELPIRYITFGYPMPGEVHLADPKTITHKILADFNNEEFQFLRHLSIQL